MTKVNNPLIWKILQDSKSSRNARTNYVIREAFLAEIDCPSARRLVLFAGQ